MLEDGHGHPYRSPARSERPASRPPRVGKLALILGALAVAACVAYWWWSQGAERRAVEALPAAERRQLYDRTLENLRFCHAHAAQESFHEYCDGQAGLALHFRECDASCARLSRMPWWGPHR